MGIPLVALMGRQPDILSANQQQAQALQLQNQRGQNALQPGQLVEQQQQIEAQKRQLAQEQAINDAYKKAFQTTPDGKMQLDPDALQTALATSGHGSAVPKIVEGLTNMQKLHNDVIEQQQKIKESTANAFGSIGSAIQQAGYDPRLSHALISTSGDNPQAQQLHQLADSDPDKFKQLVDGLVTASPEQQKLKNARDVATIRAAGSAKEGEIVLTDSDIAAKNKALTDRYQVLHPNQPLPDQYMLPSGSTQKRFDETLKLLGGVEGAQSVKAAKDNAAATRQQTFAAQQQNRADTRTDKSYQFAAGQIDKVGKPIEDAVARFGRLQDTINQKTPQADALVAPELLTVMAGGAGSGLRMNEAEISRIVGGRSNLESLKAALNKWQLDPSKALSITDSQRGQIQALMSEVHGKLLQKQSILDDSRQALVNSPSPEQHKQIVTDTHKKLTQIDTGGTQANKPPAGATHIVPGPDGKRHYTNAQGTVDYGVAP